MAKPIDHKDIDPEDIPKIHKYLPPSMREMMQQKFESVAEEAFEVIKDGMYDDNVWARIKCAESILERVIPKKTTKEITGKDGGPIEINASTKREIVLNVVDLLDKLDTEEIKERIENHGSLRLPEPHATTENGETREVEYQAPIRKGREES